MWTKERVRRELPDIQVRHTNGEVRTGFITGRDNLFGTVAPVMVEVSWATLAHCLNQNRPVRI